MAASIAYLTSFYARAGDTFIRREVEELRREGWTVHTFSIRRADEGEQVPADVLREQRTTDYILEHGSLRLLLAFVRMSLRSPARMLRAITQTQSLRWPGAKSWLWHMIYLLEASYLAERLIERKVALLHNHIAMNSGTVALLASTLANVPFSLTIHGPHDFMAAEHWALGKKVAASALTVCISSFGKSQCMLFTSPEHWPRLHVVRCGLERSFFDSPPSPVQDVPRFLCVGRLSPEKGQLLLVQAASVLRDQGVEVEIVIVGGGPALAEIEREVRERGMQERVRLPGWQSSEEVRNWISRSRAVVLPSFAEGIPVVFMEALALCRPVIGTYVGGVPELIRPGENGWLVPPGSVEDLAAAMREVIETPVELLGAMAERGRRLVRERHDISVEGQRLARLLEQATSTGVPH
jgi:glycosyltransferase involved in cell wall biosynthesis